MSTGSSTIINLLLFRSKVSTYYIHHAPYFATIFVPKLTASLLESQQTFILQEKDHKGHLPLLLRAEAKISGEALQSQTQGNVCSLEEQHRQTLLSSNL